MLANLKKELGQRGQDASDENSGDGTLGKYGLTPEEFKLYSQKMRRQAEDEKKVNG